VGARCAIHVTPPYPQKLTLSSHNGGGHSVYIYIYIYIYIQTEREREREREREVWICSSFIC